MPESEYGKEHRGNFKDFGSDSDAALAVAVRQVAASHGKKQKGDGKEIANEEDAEVLFRFAGILAEDEVDDEKLQAIVVEGALELGGDEAPETEAPGFGLCGTALLHAQPLLWAPLLGGAECGEVVAEIITGSAGLCGGEFQGSGTASRILKLPRVKAAALDAKPERRQCPTVRAKVGLLVH